VFALLLLNRFIGENPFASESGGTTVSSLARESASKILSQQLNNLAGDLISGVELNFDLVPPRITPLDNWKIKLT
jgi:hypothetical protein